MSGDVYFICHVLSFLCNYTNDNIIMWSEIINKFHVDVNILHAITIL